jgi:hypothetical protein
VVLASSFTSTVARSGENVSPLDEIKVGTLQWITSIGNVLVRSSSVFHAGFVVLYAQHADGTLKSAITVL